MNRKTEKVLGVIGWSLFTLMGLFGLIGMYGPSKYKSEIFIVMVGSFTAAFTGIVAVNMLRKNPKVSGMIFISGAILACVMTNIYLIFMVPLVAVILYVVAGIMAMRQKHQPDSTDL